MVFHKQAAIALVAGLLLSAAPPVTAQTRTTRIIIVRPVRPYFYDPFFYDPFFYYPPPYQQAERVGYVRIDTHLKEAGVYVDGGYAGPIKDFKKFPLRPGNHTIALKDHDQRTLYEERVAVVLGKTTKLKFG